MVQELLPYIVVCSSKVDVRHLSMSLVILRTVIIA